MIDRVYRREEAAEARRGLNATRILGRSCYRCGLRKGLRITGTVPHIQYFHILAAEAIANDIGCMCHHKLVSIRYFARASKPWKPAEPSTCIFKTNGEPSSCFRIFRVHGSEDMTNGRSCRL